MAAFTMETYLTVLTTDDYAIGAVALWESLQSTQPHYPFVVVLTGLVSERCEEALHHAGLSTFRIDRHLEKPAIADERTGFQHWNNTLSKLLIFDLEQYEKVVYLDSDMMVLRNLDHLFAKPHLSAAVADKLMPGHESWVQFCSGLMVIQPQAGLASAILSHAESVQARTPDYGDQDVLHAYFADWPSRPELHLEQGYGVFLDSVDAYLKNGYNLNLAQPDERTLAVIHFVKSRKPWSWGTAETMYRRLALVVAGKLQASRILTDYLRLLKAARKKLAV